MKLEKDKSRNVVSIMVWFIDYHKMKYGLGSALCIYIYIYMYLYRSYAYILCIYIYEHKTILFMGTSMYYIACMKSKARMSKDIGWKKYIGGPSQIVFA